MSHSIGIIAIYLNSLIDFCKDQKTAHQDSLPLHFTLTLAFEFTDVSAGCVFLMFGQNSVPFSTK